MSFDLTNKNISDTYQNLLQKTGSDNQLFDLLGNPVTDLTIQGALIAESYIVSQSTTVFSSGSTAFGNSSDDTHNFIGSLNTTSHITASGNISSSGDIFAHSGSFNYITASIIDVDGDTIRFGGEPFTKANIQTLKLGRSLKPPRAGRSKSDIDGDDGIFDGNITASGNISSSGIVFGSDIKSNGTSVIKSITDLSDSTNNQGKIQFTNTAGDFTIKNISNLGSSDSPKFNNITASGDIINTQVVQMTNSSSVINTFNTSSHQTCKYVLQVTSGSHIQSSEMLVMVSASSAVNTEYAQINSGLNLLDFSSKVNGSNVELIGSSSFISCSVKFNRTLI